MRGNSPEDTAIDLVIEDGTRVGTAYFLMRRRQCRTANRVAVDELRQRREARLRQKACS